MTLCKDRHGSRVVDVLWRQSEVQQKQDLAEQLIANEEELLTNYYGKIILRNCNISHYKKKQQVWQSVERAIERKRELFRDILDSDLQGRRAGERRAAVKRKKEHSEADVLDQNYAKVRKLE